MSNIVVDLSSLVPGGENGGAKILVLQLIQQMAALSPEHHFILLTNQKNTSELDELQQHNVRTFNITVRQIAWHNAFILAVFALFYPLTLFSRALFPYAITARIQRVRNLIAQWIKSKYIKKKTRADLIFYPFTAVNYRYTNVPAVSIVYDLQFHYHPYFFTPAELYERKTSLNSACKSATKIICISKHVKETVMDVMKVPSEKCIPIYIQLANRLPSVSQELLISTLKTWDLKENQYLLYPANFWQHKNHQLLFSAFNYYRSKYPDSTLKLVCTGADSAHKTFLAEAITAMGLSEWIKLPGYLTDETVASLLTGCKAMIFPSLFEGFGMPVVEAMAQMKPVLCSNLSSLPEIAGEAAILFDPRKPTEIVEALECLEKQPDFVNKLVEQGKQHVLKFSDTSQMAREYLAVFDEVVKLGSLA